MKIGITDIHSNIQALNEVLKEFDKVKVDKIICCGDIIGIGINPEETVQKLMNKRKIFPKRVDIICKPCYTKTVIRE